jgi:hypothetical protein
MGAANAFPRLGSSGYSQLHRKLMDNLPASSAINRNRAKPISAF